MVITSATNTLAITSANKMKNIIGNNISLSGFNIHTIYMTITSAIDHNQMRLTPTSNLMWFNIYHMAITAANNHVSTHNGITSAISTTINMLK